MTLFSDILAVFRRYLHADAMLSGWIAEFDGALREEGNELVFTLPGLFEFCLRHKLFNAPDIQYPQFRAAVYQNPTNTEVNAMGGNLRIYANAGKVDASLYALTRPPIGTDASLTQTD
ncbi:hypothetical protein HCH_06558 [Hahella chejuensis KCTC 2396]|uniref:Uncharacterized protein n=1 Tax=Hahella chejuensis (strain KCTC 2396) TaxID=349521 RepID=Q2S828_HAHCH|nr:hypothetical protein [Hahella chejuensis]ABC33196.1 hypothetical protein HCH_06558 [Hahella chejuensis KCTC 2396]